MVFVKHDSYLAARWRSVHRADHQIASENTPNWNDYRRLLYASIALYGVNLWLADLWFFDLSELSIL